MVSEKSLREISDLGDLFGDPGLWVCNEVDVRILRTLWTPKPGSLSLCVDRGGSLWDL